MTVKRFRSSAAALAGVILLQGCGGGDGGEPTASAIDTNHAPTISGSPPTSAQAGQAYSFTPTASDADGDTLSFSISNKPAWATFNASTGQLSGTPTAGNAGSFAGVTISVSDGKVSASLSGYTLTVSSVSAPTTGSATLAWTPPTQRSDGSTLSNLAGYKIRYGNSAGNYSETITVQNPGISSYVVDNLSSGTYFFVVTAYDSSGAESTFSNSASKTIS
jgi:hypothetical protein